MRNLIKKIANRLVFPLYHWYFSKPRKYRYGSIRAKVLPGVFTPQLTFSTRLLLDLASGLTLFDQQFLELGSGSGVISVMAARKGARVTASDINPKALENTALNASLNQVEVTTIQSDLFDSIAQQPFDLIVINPPYYPRDPENDAEKAWYCGARFEYFEKLFTQLSPYMHTATVVYMILSEDCEREKISEIAEKNRLKMNELKRVKNWWETNYLYTIQTFS